MYFRLLVATVLTLVILIIVETQQKRNIVNENISEPRAVYNNLSVEILTDENGSHMEDLSGIKMTAIIKVMALFFLFAHFSYLFVYHVTKGESYGDKKIYYDVLMHIVNLRSFFNPIICICLYNKFRNFWKVNLSLWVFELRTFL